MKKEVKKPSAPEPHVVASASDLPSNDFVSRWDKLPPCNTRCKTYLIQVRTARIGYVNAILESYDYVARIKTNDIRRGILEIEVPEDWDEVFLGAARQLAQELDLKFLSDEDTGK